MKYYSLDNILLKNAHYNVVFGERSNGKTYAGLKYGLTQYYKKGEQFAIVRRWRDDLIGKRGSTMFDSLLSNNEIEKITKGEWTDVYYYSARWWLCKYNEKQERIVDKKPFAYGFAISTMEHDKSSSYPDIRTVIFDEFLTRGGYLPNEFVLFMNVLSTIIRQRDDVKIFMFGNTVNQYSPYFAEMGLTNVKNMKQGDIDVYEYGNTGLRVAVEYSDSPSKNKKSDIYFAFDNPKLNMITNGAWEIDLYPHCPCKILPKNIIFTYFIIFDNDILQCEVISKDGTSFTYIHRKTGDIKNPNTDLVYSSQTKMGYNWRRKINHPIDELDQKLYWYFRADKVFYQDNEVGEIIRNYLQWCQ